VSVPISFLPLAADDLVALSTWLAAPHVARWWPDPSDLESVRVKYTPMVERTDTTRGFVVCEDGRPVGFLQCYALADEPGWERALAPALDTTVDPSGSMGLDYLIGDVGDVGRGVGTEMLTSFAARVWTTEPRATSLVVCVQQANAASWRALERAGFERQWSGTVDSDDPSDQGPAYVYVARRPLASC
jgi:aminoglycoside 6'-N-acetyltransferase